MLTVELPTIYRRLERLAPQRIALVAKSVGRTVVREHGDEVEQYNLTQREEILRGQLMALTIAHELFSIDMLYGPSGRLKELKKKGAFDLCIVTGDPVYQLISIAARIRKSGFKKTILVEITEDDALKPGSLKALGNYAKQHGVEDLLNNLVYLRKSISTDARQATFDVPAHFLCVDSKSGVGKKPAATKRARLIIRPFVAVDVESPPDKVKSVVTRIVRDTSASSDLKRLYDFRCQICGWRMERGEDRFLIEVHHVRPLGGEHNGMDASANMMVLCPNHHAMFDYGIPEFISPTEIQIGVERSHLISRHQLAPDVVNYHNLNCRQRRQLVSGSYSDCPQPSPESSAISTV